MKSYYAQFKQEMRDANFPVTDGDDVAIEDLKWIQPFVASEAYESGQPYDPVKAVAGIAYPSVLPSNLACQISGGVFPNATLWPSATKDGQGKYLLIGSGNPVNKWLIGNTDLVQVGFSPRYRHSPAPINSDLTGLYSFSRADAQGNAWSFALSVATKDTAKLADYTIEMHFSLDSTGAEAPELSFTYDAAANTWTEAEGYVISDSYQDPDGTVVQNIESYIFDFIKDKLLPESMRDEPIPYGRFFLRLSAKNETTGDQASITATIHAL